jgi:hypothetical protein
MPIIFGYILIKKPNWKKPWIVRMIIKMHDEITPKENNNKRIQKNSSTQDDSSFHLFCMCTN